MELLRLEAAALTEPAVELRDELVWRALAIAGRTQARRVATLAGRTTRRLDDCELRARRFSGELSSTAALDFLGDAFAALARDDLLPSAAAGDVVRRVAVELGLTPSTAALLVYRRAVASQHCLALPTALAADFVLTLMVALGPAGSASLWAKSPSGGTICVAAAGEAPRSRRMRDAGLAALGGAVTPSARFQTVVVERWDQPFAALVAHALAADASLLRSYLAEAAAALPAVLERDATLERNSTSERTIVAAGERRLVRFGCDLHDGPLQEIVALAANVRYAHARIAPLIDASHQAQVSGCFDDLEAQLASLDRELREIAQSIRPTVALERPLEAVLRGELDAQARASDIQPSLVVDGDLDGLTDSQKIVVFRVVQEALANVRKHSHARSVTVRVRSGDRVIEVSVADDGRGFDVAAAAQSGRLGLAGISERVRLLGGDVEMESRPGRGTVVRAVIPQWRPSTSAETAVYAVT